jgi:charged multivesicular body protein 7
VPTRSGLSSTLVLDCDEQLLGTLESKVYGRPLALGVAVQEALAAKDFILLAEFQSATESIYNKPWSVRSVAGWMLRQAGVADFLRSEKLPKGQFVVVANVEEAAKLFSDKNAAQSRFERTFSKTHFYKTFSGEVFEGAKLSEADTDVLLKFLSRDKGLLLYDGKTVRIKGPDNEVATLTEEDASIAQVKELLTYLTHQTELLGSRVEQLAATAKEAVAKKNRIGALAALKSKKAAEATLAQRYASVGQLEAVAAKIEQASNNVQLVAVMEASGSALASLNARVGGAERVEEVVERLREQMEAVDEVDSILAENPASPIVVDEAEIEDEMAAMEAEEKAKQAEVEKAKRVEIEKTKKEAEMAKETALAKEAEETRKRLDAVGQTPQTDAVETPQADDLERVAEGMSAMNLGESARLEPAK